jgi:hypothetical protein
MKRIKTMMTGCTLALALAPFHAGAFTEEKALEACADAMVSDLSDSRGVELDYRLDDASKGSGRRLEYPGTFHLDAKDPRSMEVVARIDCYVDSHARVRRVVSLPLSAEDAAERAETDY